LHSYKSDRPALATQLAIRTILDRPKSSSWHRQLLKPSFFRMLSAAAAKTCMEAFSKGVVQTLQATKDAEDQRTDRDDSNNSADQLYVKVITIKQLAQSLGETGLIGTDHALSVLPKISNMDPHVDVRLNVVKALLELLIVNSPQQSDGILNLLEPLLLSAGALNGREPLTEANWAECERDSVLLDFQSGFFGPPILTSLATHFRTANTRTAQEANGEVGSIVPTQVRRR
jgi:hypothetical protein